MMRQQNADTRALFQGFHIFSKILQIYDNTMEIKNLCHREASSG